MGADRFQAHSVDVFSPGRGKIDRSLAVGYVRRRAAEPEGPHTGRLQCRLHFLMARTVAWIRLHPDGAHPTAWGGAKVFLEDWQHGRAEVPEHGALDDACGPLCRRRLIVDAPPLGKLWQLRVPARIELGLVQLAHLHAHVAPNVEVY